MKKRLLAIALATLSITGITTPVAFASFPKMETCPIPDASKSSSYKTGFTANCPKGLVGEAESLVDGRDIQTVLDMVICIGSNAPADTNTNEWRQGCYDGYQAGGETYAKNLTSWPATTPDHWGICKKLQGYKALAPNTSYQDYYADGCILGYHNAVNNQPMTVGGWNDARMKLFAQQKRSDKAIKILVVLPDFLKLLMTTRLPSLRLQRRPPMKILWQNNSPSAALRVPQEMTRPEPGGEKGVPLATLWASKAGQTPAHHLSLQDSTSAV
jgi:hypothetical protein